MFCYKALYQVWKANIKIFHQQGMKPSFSGGLLLFCFWVFLLVSLFTCFGLEFLCGFFLLLLLVVLIDAE